MLIYVPMAGTGDRYLRAGYTQPKPLIPVDGVAMIERVLDAFPKDAGLRYVFGINRLHAQTTDLPRVLQQLRPDARIIILDNHKDGPVRTLLECADALSGDEDVCVNYCDFGVDWSFDDFALWLDRERWDGAMTAYTGFHPHSLGPTLYAYMRNQGERVVEIREKHHFTVDKLAEYASAGLYWFRKGRDLVRLARELVASGERVNAEFYVSMLMQRAIEQGANVGVYELEHFYQWGTPQDLRDYEAWARTMRGLDAFSSQVRDAKLRANLVVPMAGRGQRFVDRGYRDPKPLIDVAGQPMIQQALACLPEAASRVLVAQREHAADARFRSTLSTLAGNTETVVLDQVTEGQAITARLGVIDAAKGRIALEQPVLFAPCDTGYVYDVATWLALERAADAELIAWTASDHLPAIWRPHMYGWAQVSADGWIERVAVKRPVAEYDIGQQQVITGTFWFRDAHTFLREVEALVADDDRVNGEFYIDTIARRMVERGARVRAFKVDKYLPWGTPEELETFDYWNAVHRAGREWG